METRKIIKFGNSSYVITLPSEWVKEHKLDKGNQLNLKTKKDAIVISANPEEKNLVAEIEIENFPGQLLEQKIISYYLKNYNEIILKGKSILKKLNKIKQIKEKLSSIEIVEMTENEIRLKDLTNFKELNLYSFIDKMVEMVKTGFDKIIDFDKNSYEIISNLDLNINRLCFLSQKAINNNLDYWEHANQVKNSVYYWSYITALENIGDLIEDMAKIMQKEETIKNDKLKLLNQKMKNLFILITNLRDKNLGLKNNIPLYLKEKEEIEDLANSLEQKTINEQIINNSTHYFLKTLRALMLATIDLKE